MHNEKRNGEDQEEQQLSDNDLSKNDISLDSEDDHDLDQIKIEKVPVILHPNGCMYYVKSQDGNCQVIEINPKDDLASDHITIIDLKSEKCFGFTYSNESFYFLDDMRTICKLDRHKESRLLTESKQLHIKEKDRPNFQPVKYGDLIINDNYVIDEAQIFYLYDDVPLVNGVLDMVELSELPEDKTPGRYSVVNDEDQMEIKRHANGPFRIDGSQ